jgi:hypothetical protein
MFNNMSYIGESEELTEGTKFPIEMKFIRTSTIARSKKVQ